MKSKLNRQLNTYTYVNVLLDVLVRARKFYVNVIAD